MNMIVGMVAALLALGLLQSVASWLVARRFARRADPPPRARPPVTILKPLHGDEPLLAEALGSFCRLHYPDYQIVFGVQDPRDPALTVVQRLRAKYPEADIAVVVDATRHGSNRKIANLINMFPAARHDVLVIADSDLHVRPDYLDRLVTELERPGVGLVTTLYAAIPGLRGLPALLGSGHVNHGFLPGALLARAMGRQDCLGATMMLRRETLGQIGGLRALADHLADDNVLGRLVREQGLEVALAGTVPATTVPEETMRALWSHELRWARTIRALVPLAFAASSVQYPLAWAALLLALSGGAGWAVAAFALAWAVRALAARGVDGALRPRLGGLAFPAPLWLLPLRDLISVAILVASYTGRRVAWRGHAMEADDGQPLAAAAAPAQAASMLAYAAKFPQEG
jgi:ceramide glucosyltransferase